MLVYRIVREIYAHNLSASGFRNRWNEDGQYVIYTSASRSLACLENLVHRSHCGTDRIFKTMIIYVPDELSVLTVTEQDLPEDWKKDYCFACLNIGIDWYIKNEFPILKVPSSILPNEWNYILNTAHPDFGKIKLVDTEDFLFDARL